MNVSAHHASKSFRAAKSAGFLQAAVSSFSVVAQAVGGVWQSRSRVSESEV